MRENELHVLFIGGYGRSGTTLLDRILDQLDGVFAAGELRHIWERGFADNQLCGCQKPLRSCAFWTQVTEQAYGSSDGAPWQEMLKLRRRIDRARYIPALAIPALRSARFRRDFARYAEILGGLYRGIRRVSGCETIVDSSKDPSYGFALAALPGIRVTIVHMVRDSRAVAFSWQRKRARPEIRDRQEEMPQLSWTRSALEWWFYNLATETLGRASDGYLRLPYERLAMRPRESVQALLSATGAGAGDLGFLSGAAAELRPGHSVSGNPMRFKSGTLEIRADSQWRDELARRPRQLVTALTFPLLLRYGYGLRR